MGDKNNKELTFDEMRQKQRDYDKANNQRNITLEEINQYIREVRESDTSKPGQTQS